MLAFIAIAVFVSVALLSAVVLYPLLRRRELLRERVERLVPREEEHPTLLPTRRRWQTFLARMGEQFKIKPDELKSYQEATMASGFRIESVYIVLGGKLLLAASLPIIYLVFYALPHGFGKTTSLVTVILAILGYLVPSFWLDRRAMLRKDEIFHSLPDVLDLLTICVEAGLSLDAALIRTAENFQDQRNPLILEINRATLEIRAGRSRAEALRALAERTGVDDIKALVTMLVQTERFGTSLGKSLRTYSDSLRTKRKQLAEERAAKTAVKMLFPLTFFIFPALMVVLLVPAFFRIYAMFKK